MADDKIEVEIVLDGSSIKKSFDVLEREADDTSKSIGRSFSRALSRDISKPFDVAKRSIFNFRNAALGAVAVIAGALSTREIIEAASIQQDAINQLNASLQTAGTFSADASQSFQDLSASLQAQSVIGDEVIIQQAALARNFTRSNKEAERLVATAVDLSAATGISLDSAVRNLGKTLSGLTGELGEAVPQIRNLTAEQLKAGEAINVLAERFGGAALAQTRTFSGALLQLGNTFGDFLEKIGQLITASPVITNFFNALSSTFSQLSSSVASGDVNLDRFFKNQIINLASFASAVVETASVVAQVPSFINFAFTAVAQSFTRLFANLDIVISRVGASFSRLIGQVDQAQAFEDRVTAATLTLNELNNQLTQIAAAGVAIDQSFQPARNAIEFTVEEFQRLSIEASQAEVGQSPITPVAEAIKTDIENLTKSVVDNSKKIGDAINNGITNAISQGVQASVRALIAGQNAFEAFGKAILGVFGDLAIQLGQFFILQGIAAQALKFLDPTGSIAAGIGLIALGTLIKSIAGGSGGLATGGSTAPPLANVDGDGTDEGSGLTGPNQQATVVIQGDVFDTEETGLRIADILKDQGFNNAVIS